MKIDSKLIQDCRQRKRKAEFELYKLCYGPLRMTCLRYGTQEQDIGLMVNDVFMKILNALGKYDTERAWLPWIKRIAVNHLIDTYRKNKKISEVQLEEQHMDFSNNKELIESMAEMNAQYLIDMINQLPPTSGKVFNMFAIDGFSHKEIAERLNISTNTSKWHVSTARQQLQSLIAKYHQDERR